MATSNTSPAMAPLPASPRTFRHALIVVLTVLAVVPFMLPIVGVVDEPLSREVWLLVIVSTAANVFVVVHHWTAPAHPKFMMLPARRFVMRVHIFSGTAELLLGIAAMVTRRPDLAVLTAVAALFFHVPSAFGQTAIVFGSRAVMRPVYLGCIALHAFTAAQLIRFPSSMYWLVATFLIFNTYVWVRVYYFAFMTTGIFGDEKYSAAVLAAGLTTIPLVLGPTTILAISAAVLVHYLTYRALVLDRNPEAVADFVRERERDVAVNAQVREIWNTDDATHDDEAAQVYFRSLDTDHDGYLDAKDLQRAFASWRVPESLAREVLARQSLPERVDFAAFRGQIWSVGRVREKARTFAEVERTRTDTDRAALVFRRLDLDRDGYITRFELELLLVEWGLPATDVERWLAIGDSDGDGRITRDEFCTKYEPVWRFVYYQAVAERSGGEQTMSRRLFGPKQDLRKARAIRAALNADSLRGVALFAKGSPAFLDDLAQSMAEERHTAGHVLFREGDAGNAFYFIESGRVRLTAQGEPLAELGAGQCFGEGALLSDQARGATAEVAADAVCYAMTRETFEFLLGRHHAMREHLEQLHQARIHSSASHTIAVSLLARIPLFAGISGLDVLGKAAERRTVTSGTMLLREGTPGDELLVIVTGMVKVVRGGETIAELRDGALVGEMSILSGERRTADAVAGSHTMLLSLRRETLLAHPDVVARMNATRAEREQLERRRLVRLDRVRNVSALARIPDERLDALADALEPAMFRSGETIFRLGDAGDRLYIVQRGQVRIEREGVGIATVGPDGCFGELALLFDSTRTATAVAERTTEVLGLEKLRYRSLVPLADVATAGVDSRGATG